MQRSIYLPVFFTILILVIAWPLNAKRKKLPNCLPSIVIFEKPIDNTATESKEHVTGTGFITTYKGKLVVVSNLNIIFYTLSPSIKTIDGNQLTYTNILFPDDKRNIVMFELGTNTPSNYYKSLNLETNVSSVTDIGTKVVSFGCKSNWTTITRSKGEISSLGPINLEIKSNISYNMNGGPVLSLETGKVIAVISIISSNIYKKNRCKFTQGVRIDSIKSMIPLDKKVFSADSKKIKKRVLMLQKINEEYERYRSNIDLLSDRVQKELGTTNIRKLEKDYRKALQKAQHMVKQLKTPPDFEFPYFQKHYKSIFQRGENIVNEFSSLGDFFNDLAKKRKKSRNKNKLKGVDFKF